MGGEGGVDGGYHIVLVLLFGEIFVVGRILIVGTCGGEMGHGQQGAVGRGFGMVWDIHAAKGPSSAMTVGVAVGVAAHVVAIDNMAVGEDVGEHALVAELAVALASSACVGPTRAGLLPL